MKEYSIGEMIKHLRHTSGMTQATLASLLGVTDKAISKWERGLSCPDISLLPELSRTLGTTPSALLGMENPDAHEKAQTEDFTSLEKYLMGEYGYQVPDTHPKGADIVFLFDCPDRDEAEHGVALSGKRGQALNAYLFGHDRPFDKKEREEGRIAVCFISSVPLLASPDNPCLGKLIDELEFTRLNARDIHPYLFECFTKKMNDILADDTIRVIALSRWWNQKYLGAYLGALAPTRLLRLQERIRLGTLRFLFVGSPTLWAQKNLEGKDTLYSAGELLTYINGNPTTSSL